ncbi:iron-containing alcohol dehydrogenase family protein [Symbiopectobacterium sp. Eva_TO]
MQQVYFPARVVRGAGVINRLGTIASALGKRVLVLGGKHALEVASALIDAQLTGAGVIKCADIWYGGECSETQILRLAQDVRTHAADVIIAVGGGKALDTGKAVGLETSRPVITLPTIAATCAAVTPLTIRYHDDGHFRDLYHLPVAPAAVIIDSDILAKAPLRWLAAGLGDTLAKWYELRAISGNKDVTGFGASSMANSQLCYQQIARFGAAACEAVRQRQATPALDQVLDAIFLFAGLTSLMSNGAHAAAAHALYEGFTVCDKMRAYGHGLLVGFGNLCLLAQEGRSDEELLEAIALAKDCAIPTSLAAIAPTLTSEEQAAILNAAVTAPDMGNMPNVVTRETLSEAIHRVERLAISAC